MIANSKYYDHEEEFAHQIYFTKCPCFVIPEFKKVINAQKYGLATILNNCSFIDIY